MEQGCELIKSSLKLLPEWNSEVEVAVGRKQRRYAAPVCGVSGDLAHPGHGCGGAANTTSPFCLHWKTLHTWHNPGHHYLSLLPLLSHLSRWDLWQTDTSERRKQRRRWRSCKISRHLQKLDE